MNNTRKALQARHHKGALAIVEAEEELRLIGVAILNAASKDEKLELSHVYMKKYNQVRVWREVISAIRAQIAELELSDRNFAHEDKEQARITSIYRQRTLDEID